MTITDYLIRLSALVKRPDLQPRDGLTFCNIAIHEVCSWFGFAFPSIVTGGHPPIGLDHARPMMANEIYDYLLEQSGRELEGREWDRWGGGRKDVTWSAEVVADSSANLIIAAQKATPHGHVCVIHPGKPVFSGKWKMDVPLCANVGKSCFMGKGINFAFATMPDIWVRRA